MKKIILVACIAIMAVSCKKETALPQQRTEVANKSIAEQVEELIRKGSPKMYDRIYGGQKTALPSSHIHRGIFVWPSSGDPQDGTCYPNENCVCFVCVDFPKMVTEESPVDSISVGFHREYENNGEGMIIINDLENGPLAIENLKSVDVSLYDGDPALYYTLQDE